jgi:hypothetical protein
VELYLHFPNTPPWCGAKLKHRDNFTFTLFIKNSTSVRNFTGHTSRYEIQFCVAVWAGAQLQPQERKCAFIVISRLFLFRFFSFYFLQLYLFFSSCLFYSCHFSYSLLFPFVFLLLLLSHSPSIPPLSSDSPGSASLTYTLGISSTLSWRDLVQVHKGHKKKVPGWESNCGTSTR